MVLEILILTIFLLLARKQSLLWLILPISLAYDFWALRPPGLTGLRVVLFGGIFWFALGFRKAEGSKLRL